MSTSTASADRNLLFGILALQMDFIRREALIAGINAWILDKTTPLSQILVAQGSLSTEAQALLEPLVQKHVEMHDDSASRSLAALSSVDSAHPDLTKIADADVQASLGHMATVSAPQSDSFATRDSAVGVSTSEGTRFRILRPHARGGLGEVFVARDLELGREVALKEIQDCHADDLESRARFVREAEITGGLEHPGIVPVYGLGQYADGRPYYAMRFIKGDSLKEAIDRFHKRRPAGNAASSPEDEGERAVEFRQLLGRFIEVCNAIAYAHSRGVLHRDLKPGNIMLGKYGETLVVDWGLAKIRSHPPYTPPSQGGEWGGQASEEQPLQTSLTSVAPETVLGRAVGTPQFMSPEQAAGRLDQLGPASDVYSLGATLYSLLTGKPPLTGADLGVILNKCQRGEFLRPRQVRPTVPRGLEAICLKAMALKPEDRYATTRALADDVEHWLADEPVTAFREPWPARAGRWARRHRTGVTSAVAALLVGSVGLLTATVLLTAANERERAAKERERAAKELALTNEKEAEEQRDEANKQRDEVKKQRDEASKQRDEANKQRDKARERFQLARTAVDKFHTQVSQSPEMKAQGVEKLRATLLETAVEFYQKFVEEEEGNDPQVQHERGYAFMRLANLCSTIGRHEPAEQAYRDALAIQKKLVADHPSVAEYHHGLARSHHGIGILYSATGRNSEAEQAYQAALAILKKLVADHPTVTDHQQDLALTHNRLGILYRATGRNAEAEKAYQDALAVQKKLAADHPALTEYQRGLARSHNNLAILYSATGRRTEAEKAYQDALAIQKQLAAEHPTVTEYQRDLASGHYNLGILYGATGRNAEAEKAHQDALAIQKKLAADHPAVTEYQQLLARSYNGLGIVYRATGRNLEAEKAYHDALAIRRKLAADYSAVTDYQIDLASSYNTLGILYGATGRHAEAEKAYQDALVIQLKLTADHPTVTEYQRDLANSHSNLGVLYDATGRRAEAEKAYQDALAIQKKLAANHPTVTDYQQDLARSHGNLGLLYDASSRRAEAAQAYQEAVAIREKLAAAHPQRIEFALDLGGSCLSLANVLRDSMKPESALVSYSRALEVFQVIVEKDKQDARARRLLRNTRSGRAVVLGRLKRHVEALAEANELARDKALSASNAYDLACVLSLVVAAVSAAEREKIAEEYTARAVVFLTKAAAAGLFKDPKRLAQMKKDTDLDALRERDDFKKLLTELEQKMK